MEVKKKRINLKDFDNKRWALLIFSVMLIVFSAFTSITNFNLSGYSYQLDDDTMIMTIKKGFLVKESYTVHAIDDNSLQLVQQVVIPIHQAEKLWVITMIFLSLFIAFLYIIIRTKKNTKWLVALYILCLLIFFNWSYTTHKKVVVIPPNIENYS